MLNVEDMIADVASIDRQHLPRHPLVAAQTALAVLNETFASRFDCKLARIMSIDTRGKLALDADTESIGSFLIAEVLALALPSAVVVIDKLSGFGFAFGGRPTAFAD